MQPIIGIVAIGGALYAGLRGIQHRSKQKKRVLFLTARPLTGGATRKVDKQTVPLLLDAASSPQRPVTETLQAVDTHETERKVNRYIAVSSAGLGAAVAGVLFFPPLSLLSAAASIYGCIPLFREAYNALAKERRLRASVVDSLGAAAALAMGYYGACTLAIWFFFVAKKLELKTRDRSRRGLVNIFGEQPRTVWVFKEGVEIEIPFERLQRGDTIVVNAGQMIPVDGVIIAGVASIDQHRLTGESQLAEKGKGEQVFAATVVLAGRINIQVEKTGAEMVAAQITEILTRTADYKSFIEARGTRIADQSVMPLLGASALALLTLGRAGTVAVLNSNYFDNMRIAAPLSMLNFLSLAARKGILVKDGRALELLNTVDTIVFDKTGTLTLEQPYVGNIYAYNGFSEEELLIYAAAAEAKQMHSIARAILQAATERQLALPTIDDARYQIGYGIQVNDGGRVIRVGSARFMNMEGVTLPAKVRTVQDECHARGSSLVYVAIDNQLGGAIELRPTVRPEAKGIIQALHARGLTVYIISGDQTAPTQKLATELGIDHYLAEVLPEGKATLVEQLQQEGRSVCFVGDGINDAIALKKANASISLGGATTIATDAAQIILMDGTLRQLVPLLELTQDFDTNLRGCFATALVPTIISIGGIFFLHFGIFAAIMGYSISLVASLANAMAPVLRQQHPQKHQERERA